LKLKKCRKAFFIPGVGTVGTVEVLLRDVYERLQRLNKVPVFFDKVKYLKMRTLKISMEVKEKHFTIIQKSVRFRGVFE